MQENDSKKEYEYRVDFAITRNADGKSIYVEERIGFDTITDLDTVFQALQMVAMTELAKDKKSP